MHDNTSWIRDKTVTAHHMYLTILREISQGLAHGTARHEATGCSGLPERGSGSWRRLGPAGGEASIMDCAWTLTADQRDNGRPKCSKLQYRDGP